MLSVLMATHNGADTIARSLAAMNELVPPPGGWKLVVVNNASTDDTEAQVLAWQDRLPLVYVVEPKLGKPVALNAALQRAEGDLIVMTDDDVIPDPTWLLEWRRIADRYPDCSVFGGAIVPEFEAPPPPWLDRTWCTMLFGATPERAEGEAEPNDILGANMAVRRSIIDEGWRFDEKFFKGLSGLMGEDADFIARLAARGHKVCFAPHASIRHMVKKHQTSWRSMQYRFFRHGQYLFMAEEVSYDPASGLPLVRFPKWRLRRLAEFSLRLFVVLLSFDDRRLFSHLRTMSHDLGVLTQALSLMQERRAARRHLRAIEPTSRARN